MVDSADDEPTILGGSLPSPRKRFLPRKPSSDLPASSSQPYPVVNGVLKISDHALGISGATSLLRAARNNPQLTELDLTGCSISKGDELAETIRSAPSLCRLVLEWNNLGLAKTGIAALSSAIASSRTLKEVDLRSNRIGPTMAAALAHALRNNCSLTSLDLRWNEIGASGAIALIGMLERNKVLTDLQLAGNNISPSLQTEIDRLLERNRAGVLDEDYLGSFAHPHQSDFDSSQKGDDVYQKGRRAHLQYDLSKLRNNLEMLKEECQSLQSQQDSTNTQLETVKNELKEEGRLRMYIQKEGQDFKEQALKAREDVAALQDKFLHDSSAQNSILMEAREMHAAAMTQCEALQDEILRLREEHSQELRELAERAGKEADYNIDLMNKMDNTLHEHDHMYMQEINKLHLKLSEESREKEDALRELEKHRSLVETAEQNWLREKDAHEQALRNTAALTSEVQSLQVEVEKLMKQLSRIKKSHAGEMGELEKIILYHKQVASRAEQEMSDFAAERKQLLENIKLLEDKGKVLEKKLELQRLQNSETLQNELIKHKDDRRTWEQEVQNARHMAELSEQRLQEIQVELERRKYDQDGKLQDAEMILSKAIQQQFSELRATTGAGKQLLKYSKF